MNLELPRIRELVDLRVGVVNYPVGGAVGARHRKSLRPEAVGVPVDPEGHDALGIVSQASAAALDVGYVGPAVGVPW